MPALPPLLWKLIGGAVAALALFMLVQDRNHWKKVAADRNAELTNILAVTREAAGNPGLDRANLPRQIRELGAGLAECKGRLGVQSAAVRRLGAETVRLQGELGNALKAASERARGAAGTRGRLEASAAAPERQRAPCELSPTLKEAWK